MGEVVDGSEVVVGTPPHPTPTPNKTHTSFVNVPRSIAEDRFSGFEYIWEVGVQMLAEGHTSGGETIKICFLNFRKL